MSSLIRHQGNANENHSKAMTHPSGRPTPGTDRTLGGENTERQDSHSVPMGAQMGRWLGRPLEVVTS